MIVSRARGECVLSQVDRAHRRLHTCGQLASAPLFALRQVSLVSAQAYFLSLIPGLALAWEFRRHPTHFGPELSMASPDSPALRSAQIFSTMVVSVGL